jgi:cysteine desulfurase family protein (TIGR01976 family)
MARTLSMAWSPGMEVVVSRLDHDANVRPWVQAAEEAGATVRWADVDLATGELPVAQYAELIGPNTTLVAVTAASNAIGTVPAVRQIADLAHAAGAHVYVDGVHATAHRLTDVRALGADMYVTSAYKWSGPHYAALVAEPWFLSGLMPAKLLPSPWTAPDKFEYGTLSFELLAGITAAVDHLAGLGDLAGPAAATRRQRLVASFAAITEHEDRLTARLLAGLTAIDGVTICPAPPGRCPTVSFRVGGQAPADTARLLGDQGICVSSGDYYAVEYFLAAGLRDSGGAVRASIYHYNTEDEIDRLLTAVAKLGR